MKKVNIKTISKIAGVSPTTISFVLNNKKGVSEETRQKVLQVIEEERYVPNINSRRLSLNRSFNIALITNAAFEMFGDVFATKAMKAAVESATELGYNVLLLPATEDNRNEHLLSEIQQGNVDGAIVFHDVESALCNSLSKRDIPLVVIDSHLKVPPYSAIMIDYEKASYTAVSYFISQGHKKIAYIGLESLPNYYLQCLNGYKKAMMEASLPIEASWMSGMAVNGLDSGGAVNEIMGSANPPTAIFCGNDLTAIGAMHAAEDLGYTVPNDLSFASIDDIFISEFYNPPLTTVRVDAAAMGNKSIEILDKLISGKTQKEFCMLKSDDLIIRDSVRAIADK